MKEYHYKEWLWYITTWFTDNDLCFIKPYCKTISVPINWNDKAILWNKSYYTGSGKRFTTKIDNGLKCHIERIFNLMVFA